MNPTVRRRSNNLTTTSIHTMALDGIVNVNSLFTVALFLGLSTNGAAAAAEHLVAFHVYSFSSFLFSSLVASGLKLAIVTADDGGEVRDVPAAHVNLKLLRAGILTSAVGSASGCVFLTLAIVDLVRIKVASLGCGSWYGWAAVGPLVTLVPWALVVYIFIVLHAFTT